MSLLEIRDLCISYGAAGGGFGRKHTATPTTIVDSLSLSIPEGAIFGLAGESGSGKSLTALAAMGILPRGMRATGQILYRGEDLLAMDEERLRSLRGSKISMVFQEPMTSLNPVLRVGYQIEEVINTHLQVSKSHAHGIAVGLLRELRIPSPEIRMREYPHQMSGGMRQRIMMAMAIACGPDMLIADEPTTALDVTVEAQLLALLRRMRKEKNMGVLLITHDLGIIAENAEAAAIMYAGRFVEIAPVTELFNRPMHPYTVGLLNSLPQTKGTALIPIPGSVPRPGFLPAGCAFSDRCSFVQPRCLEVLPGLTRIEGAEESDLPHVSRCHRVAEAPWRKAVAV